MRAVRFQGVGRPPLVTEIAKPEPGPGQVVIKIGGAGACHSDVYAKLNAGQVKGRAVFTPELA